MSKIMVKCPKCGKIIETEKELKADVCTNCEEAYIVEQAFELFKEQYSSMFKDSKNETVKSTTLKNKIVEFGTWEQKNDGTQESIKWIILNEKDDELFLLSLYGLEAREYNEIAEYIKWSDCSLKKWLQGEFFQKAFNSREKEQIVISFRKENNSLIPLFDMVSLLSLEEAREYLSKEQLLCKPTEWCKGNGGWISEEGYGVWWLLQPGQEEVNKSFAFTGYGPRFAGCVAHFGEIMPRGDSLDDTSNIVRPVITVRKDYFNL